MKAGGAPPENLKEEKAKLWLEKLPGARAPAAMY